MTQRCTGRNCHPVAITGPALRPLQTLSQYRQFLMYLLRGFIQTHLGQQLHHNLVRLSSGVQIAAGGLPNRLHRSIQVPVGNDDLRSHEASCVRMIHGLAYLRCNTCHFPRTFRAAHVCKNAHQWAVSHRPICSSRPLLSKKFQCLPCQLFHSSGVPRRHQHTATRVQGRTSFRHRSDKRLLIIRFRGLKGVRCPSDPHGSPQRVGRSLIR